MDPTLADRFVKIRASDSPDVGPYRLSSGFIVREGIIIASAHGVVDAGHLVVRSLTGATVRFATSSGSIRCPSADDIEAGRRPDLALIRCPDLGTGLKPFPLAVLARTGSGDAHLRNVSVVGFPAFMEASRRQSFQDEGKIALLTRLESGLFDVSLSTTPAELDPRSELPSQWSGISGSPVLVGGHLIGVVTEHSRAAGAARLTATPLSLGTDAAEDPAWWQELGVSDPSRLPRLPGPTVRAAWLEDLRTLRDELGATDVDLPARFRRPVHFAVQAHEAVRECVENAEDADPSELVRRLRPVLDRPALDPGPSLYGVTLSVPLTARTLVSLLPDLARVHEIVETRVPSLAGRIRYRVAAPLVLADEVDEAQRRWVAEHDEGPAHRLLDRLEISERADPHGAAIAALRSHGLDGPGTIRELVEWFLSDDFGLDDDALSAVRRCLLPAAGSATLLTSADVEPAETEFDADGFLVNEQPTRAHLRQGFFAASDDVAAAEKAYWSWYRESVLGAPERVRGSVPCFWLTGPSGAGKSVLLLQLLARLNSRAGVSVLWVGEAGAQLDAATTQVLGLAGERHVVVGVDDPLVLTEQGGEAAWRDVLGTLGERRQSGDPTVLPVFVCAGPTEHFASFARAHVGEVRLGRYVLDPYRTEFTGQLREWYQRRTRRPAPAVEGRLLPAQLFFEWWKGEGTAAFARRFRDRIASRNLPELSAFFERLLAVNQLYVGYPSAAVERLTPAVRDAVTTFEVDMHLHPPTLTRPGYWLSHPQLAGVFYDAWFPDAAHHQVRADHLAAAWRDAIDADLQGWASLPLLEQLLLNLERPDGGDSRVLPDQIATAFKAVRRSARLVAATVAAPVLAAWVRLARALPHGAGGWSPSTVAVDRLGQATDEAGVDVLVAALAAAPEPDVEEAIWELLERRPELQGWVASAQLLIGRPAAPGHAGLVASVVRSRPDRAAIELLATAVRAHPFVAEFTSAAVQLLSNPPAAVDVAPLAASLYGLASSRDAALEWLHAAVRPQNQVVLVAVLEGERIPLDAWSELVKWVVTYPTEPFADTAFVRLLSWNRLRDTRFREAFCEHLHARDNRLSSEVESVVLRLLDETAAPGWALLFTSLTVAQGQTEVVQERARAWLEQHPESTAWHHVFTHLCEVTAPPDDTLVDLGLQHREIAWDFPHCARLFNAITVLCPEGRRPEVAAISMQWLDEHPEQEEGWGYLARPVLRDSAPSAREATARRIFAWWEKHQEGQSASYVIRGLMATPLPPSLAADIVAAARNWLARPRLGWGHVFLDLCPRLSVDDVAAVAVPWLSDNVDDDRWGAVLDASVDALTDAQARDLARLFFGSDGPTPADPGFVWRILVEERAGAALQQDAESREVVRSWLRRNGQHKAWWHLWRELHASDPTDLAVVGAGVEADLFTERSYGVANALRRTLTNHPELIDTYWEFLGTLDRTTTWRLAWYHLSSFAPTATCWQLGLSELPALNPDLFSTWWRRLWASFPDGAHHAVLRPLARTWMDAHADDPAADTVAELIREEQARRVNPATVFGAQKGLPTPARTASPTSPRPHGRATPQSGRGTGNGRLACPSCGTHLDLPPQTSHWVCLRCATSLDVDQELRAVTELQSLRPRAAVPVAVTHADPDRTRTIVLCEVCGREYTTVIRTDDEQFAVDRTCGYLYAVARRSLAAPGLPIRRAKKRR